MSWHGEALGLNVELSVCSFVCSFVYLFVCLVWLFVHLIAILSHRTLLMWTTRREYDWLSDRIPQYHDVRAAPSQQIQLWLRKTSVDFTTAFPNRSTEEVEKLVAVRRLFFFSSAQLTDPLYPALEELVCVPPRSNKEAGNPLGTLRRHTGVRYSEAEETHPHSSLASLLQAIRQERV